MSIERTDADGEKRDFISIHDLSNEEVEILFVIADKMKRLLRRSHGLLGGHIMGSLFLEPSTRTRLSFEAAMNRLGGRVLTLSESGTSSFAKGETLADSVRIVSSYADLIVLRHPLAGAARVAAESAPVPVINAGDGGHEHPTQTLCDLYTLRNKKGRLDGLRVVLYGDLKYGRTTHSLAAALARFGADILCIPETGLDLPESVRDDCAYNSGAIVRDVEISGLEGVIAGPRRALLICRDVDRWPAVASGHLDIGRIDLDAIYVTRLQEERLVGKDLQRAARLPHVDVRFLALQQLKDAVVLHPLPRMDEIDRAVDQDPRGVYFEQAALGVPIRMALLSFLLGREIMRADPPAPSPVLPMPEGVRCEQAGCISSRPAEHVTPRAWRSPDGALRCRYCDERVGADQGAGS